MPSPLPHSLFNPETGVRLCLFVKDPVAEVADKLAERPVPGFAEVMGYSRLSRDFKQYKDRRELLKSYDGFFVDDRILPMMPRVLGKVFYSRKKQPWPVPMGGSRSLENALAKVRDSTPLYLGAGMCVAVKVGTTGMTAGQIAENITAVVAAAVDAVPKKWRNVASISLKLPSSLSLPLYAALPAAEAAAAAQVTQGSAQAGHAASDDEEAAGAGSDFEQGVVWDEEEAPAPAPAPRKARGTKRSRAKPAVKSTRSTTAAVGEAPATRRSKRKAGGERFFEGK